MSFQHPEAHAGKSPEQLVEDLAAELAGFGKVLQDLGSRLEQRPERVTSGELYALLGEAAKAGAALREYRKALTTSWRLEYLPARQDYGEEP
jgi:hypothetical protein